jgi:hypothetical protein
MSNVPHDIMMAAHDKLGHEVSLTIHDDSALGGLRVYRAIIVHVNEADEGHIVVEDFRDAAGHTALVIPRTVLYPREIVEIR